MKDSLRSLGRCWRATLLVVPCGLKIRPRPLWGWFPNGVSPPTPFCNLCSVTRWCFSLLRAQRLTECHEVIESWDFRAGRNLGGYLVQPQSADFHIILDFQFLQRLICTAIVHVVAERNPLEIVQRWVVHPGWTVHAQASALTQFYIDFTPHWKPLSIGICGRMWNIQSWCDGTFALHKSRRQGATITRNFVMVSTHHHLPDGPVNWP